MGENLVVLVIFFFLLVVAVVFYAGIQTRNISVKEYEFSKRGIMDTKTFLGRLPELMCVENKDPTVSCVDIVNLGYLKSYWDNIKNNATSKERNFYYDLFGDMEIIVRSIDILTGDEANNWTIYNNTPQNYRMLDEIYIPITLYNLTSDEYGLGYIEMTVYT